MTPAGESAASAAVAAIGLGFEAYISRWSSPGGGARAGGDWCDIHEIGEDAIAFSVGDVSGHGEAVSDTMEFLRSAVADAMRSGRTPSGVLEIANELAYAHEGGTLATAIVAVVNGRLRTLTFSNAGHPPPIMVRASGHAFLSRTPGDLPLGTFRRHRAAEYVVALRPATLLALYTDGLTEHERDPLEGERQLAQACRLAYDFPQPDAARAIADFMLAVERGVDDAAVLAVRLGGGSPVRAP